MHVADPELVDRSVGAAKRNRMTAICNHQSVQVERRQIETEEIVLSQTIERLTIVSVRARTASSVASVLFGVLACRPRAPRSYLCLINVF
jgi:hypothetical protein